MAFTIYTAGDATFLEEVLNSVAMVTSSGAIAKVAAVGALITVLLLGFRAIMEGGRAIRFEELILGFIVYMAAFYPTTTVLIEDGYTGNVHPVSNVPLGPAVTGYVISSIGYKLTSIFEQGYSFTSHGSDESLHKFAEPLKLMMALRSSASNPLLMNTWNSMLGPHADIRRSWENYIKHCSLVKVDLGLSSVDKIVHGDPLEVLGFDSHIYGTQLFFGVQGGEEFTCADGYVRLREAMQIGFAPNGETDKVLHALITKGVNDDDWGGQSSAQDKLESAVTPILGYGTDIQKYVQATVLDPVFRDAVEGKYLDMQDTAAAIAFRQSLQQRNTQWAQEQSAFMTVIRPAMTFFEGFVYAATPMLAMLMVMGRFGMSLAGKYLQTVFWVQLWLPILSICNLYIRNAVEKQVQATYHNAGVGTSMNFESFYMANNIPEIVESWLATGSMLAAATPMLAFFLISGSSYAFTNVAGRLGGQDHFNEKLVTPDAVDVGSANSVQTMMNHSMAGGAEISGSEGTVPMLAVGQRYGEVISSANTDTLTAQQGFTNTAESIFGSTQAHQKTFGIIQSMARNGSLTLGQDAASNKALVENIASKFGVSQDLVRQDLAAVGAQAAVTGQTPKFAGFSAKLQGSASKEQSWTAADKENYASEIQRASQNQLSMSDKAQYANQFSNAVNASGNEQWSRGLTSSQLDKLQQSASKVSSAQRTYQEVSSQEESFESNQRLKYNNIANRMHGAGMGSELADIIGHDASLQGAAKTAEDMYRSDAFGWGANTARIAGALTAIMDHGTTSQKLAAMQAIKAAYGGSFTQSPAVDNSNLKGAVDPSSIQAEQPGQVDARRADTEMPEYNLGGAFKTASNQLDENHKAGAGYGQLEALTKEANKFANDGHTLANAVLHNSGKFFAGAAGKLAARLTGHDPNAGASAARGGVAVSTGELDRFRANAGGLPHNVVSLLAGARFGSMTAEQVMATRTQLAEELADRDRVGNIIRDGAGEPVLNEKATSLINAVDSVALAVKSAPDERTEGLLRSLSTAVEDTGGWNNYIPPVTNHMDTKPHVLNRPHILSSR